MTPAPLDYASPPLRRQIGLFGAVMLGLGSILGTGVFVGLAQATALAGPWVLLAIVLAGALAFCNAMSSAQLAAAHPVAGGTYEYGYRLLSPAWGFTAGWTFLLAKSASAATAALAIGSLISVDHELREIGIHLGSRSWEKAQLINRGMSVLIAAAFTALVLAGLRRSTQVNHVVVLITVAGLFSLTTAMVYRQVTGQSPMMKFWISLTSQTWSAPKGGDIARAASLVFVAFAGFARIATLSEEVREPQKTIPRAMTITLAVSLVLYLGIGFLVLRPYSSVLMKFFHDRPLTAIATTLEFPGLLQFIRLAALSAMLGVLLNLILGLSRVWLAMGRRGDMPRSLASVSERSGTPVPATILSGLVIAAFVLVGDVRLTWSFSAFSVLIYYAITNWACLRLPIEHRRYPRSLAWVGLVSCLSLAWFIEVKVWAVGVGLIGVGLVWHRLRASARERVAAMFQPA